MKRREFIVLAGGVSAWPLVARAQKPAMPVIGVLESGNAASPTYPTAAFHAGLKESGFVEGQNVTIEYRMAETQYDRLPALMADLI
jgi:putative ABC transport system substrate-binding protein